jgi:isopentenyl diphosphate isomerase/L-lactate dehydrogenase-like FMN-dependent dehydrogenase
MVKMWGGSMDVNLTNLIAMAIEAFGTIFITYTVITKRLSSMEKRLEAQYRYVREAAVQASVAVAWGEKAPFVEVIKAMLLAIKLETNGNMRTRLVEVIMGMENGKSLFESILNAYKKDNPEVRENKYFNDTIEWVYARIV